MGVDQKILLLRADIRQDALHAVIAEQAEHPHAGAGNRFHRAQQRGLFVEHLARIGDKARRDAERAVLDKGVGGRVPCGIAARLEGRAQAAGRERGGIRLALDELLAGEFEDDAAVFRCDEGVVLFRGDAGHRLEPVRIMRAALGDRPVLHSIRNDVGGITRQRRTHGACAHDGLIYLARQAVRHDALIEDIAAEIGIGSLEHFSHMQLYSRIFAEIRLLSGSLSDRRAIQHLIIAYFAEECNLFIRESADFASVYQNGAGHCSVMAYFAAYCKDSGKRKMQIPPRGINPRKTVFLKLCAEKHCFFSANVV